MEGTIRDFEFQILFSRGFCKFYEYEKSVDVKRRLYETVADLACGKWEKYDVSYLANKTARLVRKLGLPDLVVRIRDSSPRQTLYFYDVGARDPEAAAQHLDSLLNDANPHNRRKAMAFARIVPDWAMGSSSTLDEILRLEKVNLLLTPLQAEVLAAKAPVLIHGRAGSGKTLLLCYGLAIQVHSNYDSRLRLAFLSYNNRLVDKARSDTQDILLGRYEYKNSLEGVNFSSLQAFLKSYVKNPEHYDAKSYVGFYRFKKEYDKHSLGTPELRRLSAERAWHGIRSILKGACLPPFKPPLSKKEYERLAKRRKDFTPAEFDLIYGVGEWYQHTVIEGSRLWDDQDLAWDALSSIIEEKALRGNGVPYEKIFCDEAQDLTQLEFRTLIEVSKPPAFDTDGFQLVMAADPLQTINPTGFRWNIVKNEIYRAERGRLVDFAELAENFRSDQKIVDFANMIQGTRSRFIEETPEPQEGFLEEGPKPQALFIEGGDALASLQKKLGELPPESAVIIWPEDPEEVKAMAESEPSLRNLNKDLDLYTVSQAKGLEFGLVVLYKIGSSADAARFRKYLDPTQGPRSRGLAIDDQIPLMYFLNRLYVAATRARLYLVVIDTREGLEKFWSIWKGGLEFISPEKVKTLIEDSPTFRGDMSPMRWIKWGQTLFDYAEDTRDLSAFERARQAFVRAGDTTRAKRVVARVQEIEENWSQAGLLYSEAGDLFSAANCFEHAGKWGEAYECFEKLPTNKDNTRRMAICKFRRDLRADRANAAREFYEYSIGDDGIERAVLEELGDILSSLNNDDAAAVLERVGRKYKDTARLIKAAQVRFNQGNFADAKRLFELAGETQSQQYGLSVAETARREGDFDKAIEFFYNNGADQKVVDCYEQALQIKPLITDSKRKAADSYLRLSMKGEAGTVCEELSSEYIRKGRLAEAIGIVRPDIFSKDRRAELLCGILAVVAKTEGDLTSDEAAMTLEAVRVAVADPYWKTRIAPETMGSVYLRCADSNEIAEFFRRYADQGWARSPLLKALDELAKLQRSRGNEIAVQEIETEIRDLKERWGTS